MQTEGERGTVVEVWRVYGLTIIQIVATEGEKTCSNLEQGVLNWFQRRELEGCQKTKAQRRKLGEVSCSREDCYCRGWLQLIEDHEGSSNEKWVELLRTRRSI